MMNFREELSIIKQRKLQEEDNSQVGKILKESIIPYIEKKVSPEKITEGIELTVYHCEMYLLIVIGDDVVHKQDFMEARETSELIAALKSRFVEEGFKITESSLYRFVVIIKA